jgi:glycosyltransferase involved in cell wall biosynthesis
VSRRQPADIGIPAVTVLIDTYNHERYIQEAMVSVLEQDFPRAEMEILVVDDGSTDRTPEIVRKFAPGVRLIQKNKRRPDVRLQYRHSRGQG